MPLFITVECIFHHEKILLLNIHQDASAWIVDCLDIRKEPLFYIGIRKCNVIHAQLRMNCSNLNAHLHSLHVIDSPACVCSHSIEDTAHFFLCCPLYYTQRLALQNIVSRYTDFKLETLLFGDTNIDNVDNITIILAVHDYIKNSERL